MSARTNAMALALTVMCLARAAGADEKTAGRLDRFKTAFQEKMQLIKDGHAALFPLARSGPGPSAEKMMLYGQRKAAAKPGSIRRALNHVLQIRSADFTDLGGASLTASVQAESPLVLQAAAAQSTRWPVQALYRHAARVAARQVRNDRELMAVIRDTMRSKWLEVSTSKKLLDRMGGDFDSILKQRYEVALRAFQPYENAFPDVARQLKLEHPPR